MSIRLDKPWKQLNQANVDQLAGQLGVYELADDSRQVIYIGQADARSRFGLRSELQTRLGTAPYFRYEVNMAYSTRYQELLMVYKADYGCLPVLNQDPGNLGSLSPSGSAQSRELPDPQTGSKAGV